MCSRARQRSGAALAWRGAGVGYVRPASELHFREVLMMRQRTKKRPHADTTVPSIPADERDIMAALLRTPPPPAGDKSTRKGKAAKRGQKKGGRKR
jgi:hypothetical protein